MTEDQDPTGMRHLLAGLKETGPMPEELNERIRASLADEQATRTAGMAGDDDAEHDDTGFWTTMDEGTDGARRRRRPMTPWILGAAAAAVVAMGVGGLVATGGSSDDAADGAPAASRAEDTRSAGSGDDAAGAASPSADDEVPAFVITASGNDYSKQTVADGAASLLDNPTEFPTNEDEQALGTLTTAAGATDCLGRLGYPQMQAIVIDVATFDGRSGLLLVADSPPDGPAKAWAITAGCEPIWPDPIDVTTR